QVEVRRAIGAREREEHVRRAGIVVADRKRCADASAGAGDAADVIDLQLRDVPGPRSTVESLSARAEEIPAVRVLPHRDAKDGAGIVLTRRRVVRPGERPPWTLRIRE